ncbi:MAG: HDOD domain-containing protein [Thiohalobacteraceae bacterium]|nr:HDOD domain-containing protein [Gammaproteobacteria bacterium]
MQQASQQATLAGEIRRRIEQVYQLPPMPDMARRILQLRSNPDASVADLAAIIELDPSLAAQVVRYAASPFYAYRGKINSIQDAITRVLGFDLVMNMALGLATGRSFHNPIDGPLGLHAFWRHSVYTAALVQTLAKRIPPQTRPQPGMVYLAGLLHNFGFLLLGHLFPPEFKLLNKLVAAHPESPVTALEKCVLGMGQAQNMLEMGHAQIGAWLMYSWHMPDEIIVTLREHHNPDYSGEHAILAHLVMIADHVLKGLEIGDAPDADLPLRSLEIVGLSEDTIREFAEQLFENCSSLDMMARQLATG